jgi:3-oxoacyl-[acyl-carrier protein] reductase
MKTIVVVGASRGIGDAISMHLRERGASLISVSRTPARAGRWVQADVSTIEGIQAIAASVADCVVDALIYVSGTWESKAFSKEYQFQTCSDDDLVRILNVNLLAPIRLTKAILPSLERSTNPKLIYLGSTSGLENYPGREVAYGASKFGLRGAVHALREELRPKRIGVTIINPGNVATEAVIADLASGQQIGGTPIPVADLLAVIDCILSLSRASCIKEVDLPAMGDAGA